uniref:Uncharacterized protein n=1 Tax=Anopheles maculatus TaxID=74869 RepID=A0A182SQN3_9DIPT
MAQFVTHIQPTLIEASQGHVPHHHGHQVGIPHTSHLPHSGHNMPSPPTHHGHSHGHVHGHSHHHAQNTLVHSASREMSNTKGSSGHKAPSHLPLSPKTDDHHHHHHPHYQHVEGYYQHAPLHYQQHHHGHSHGHHHSGVSTHLSCRIDCGVYRHSVLNERLALWMGVCLRTEALQKCPYNVYTGYVSFVLISVASIVGFFVCVKVRWEKYKVFV